MGKLADVVKSIAAIGAVGATNTPMGSQIRHIQNLLRERKEKMTVDFAQVLFEDELHEREEIEMDPTVELSARENRDLMAERAAEIAAICWQECPNCKGRKIVVQHWEADDGGPDHVLTGSCARCDGTGTIQLHDPYEVEALYDAADDARAEMGVWCYTRIDRALSLAINGAVSGTDDETAMVASETSEGKNYYVTPRNCGCHDAHYRAPMIEGKPACKHQIAVWLVKAAEKKIHETYQVGRGRMSDCLDGLISYEEACRQEREAE